MRRLTVVQLLPALQAGGVERSTLEIAAALVEAGHRAIVVSAGGRLVPELQRTGAEHVELDIGRKSPLTWLRVPALRGLLLRERADIVHARSRLPAWMARLALRTLPEAGRPHFVTTVHGLNTPGRYSEVMTTGERVICVSDTVREHVLAHYPRVDPGVLRVVPRGIDPMRFPRRPWPDAAARAVVAQRWPALGGGGPLLLLPGRGTRLKGHADALRLLAALRASGLDARLWLLGADQAGRADYLAELRAEAAGLGVEAALAISPPTSDMVAAYAASDLVLQLSRKPEAFGRTVVEASGVGRPVLGWAHGGVGELLAALQPAGAVPVFDETRLAQVARACLAQPPALPASLPYTLQAMQRATLAVYEELVA